MLISLVAVALSAEPVSPPLVRGASLGAAAAGEAVTQGGLVDAYPRLGGSLSLEAVAALSWTLPIETTLELGFRRVEGGRSDDSRSWIWYVPGSLLVSGRLDLGVVSLLGGAGPSAVLWQEAASDAAVAGRLDWGVRWGLLTEASVRWRTTYLRPTMAQGTGGPQGLDLFVAVGGRFSDVADSAASTDCNGEPCGFDWSAVRLSGGALVRF